LKQISKNADQLAAQLAPTMAADWMRNTQARYMAQLGTGKIPTLLDGKAEDVTPTAPVYMPVLAEKPQAQPLNIGALWQGLFNAATGKGHKFQSVTVPSPAVVPVPKPTESDPTADPSFPDAPKP
jgi:hypothetical protein